MRERLHHAFTQAHIRMPSQLVDLGGMAEGSPVRVVGRDGQEPTADTRERRRGLVPPDVTPLDEPAKVDLDEVTGDAYEDTRDRTAELRIVRGPEPRPD